MARYPLTRIKSAIASGKTAASANYRSNSSYANREPPVTRGVTLAQDFFGIYDYGDDCEAVSDDYDSDNYRLVEDIVPVQMELALETEDELRERLRRDIQRFERAYDMMSLYAVRWKQLMEDVEENPQLKKMFKDIQLMRKLSGSEFE